MAAVGLSGGAVRSVGVAVVVFSRRRVRSAWFAGVAWGWGCGLVRFGWFEPQLELPALGT